MKKKYLSLILCISISFAQAQKEEDLDSFEQSIDQLTDERNNMTYEIIQINSVLWFNENLSYPSENSVDIKKYNLNSNGRLYAYSDIHSACPEEWRLPKLEDLKLLTETIFKEKFYGLLELNYDWIDIEENSSGFKFGHTGFLHKKKYKSKESFNIWLEDVNGTDSYHVHMHAVNKKSENLTLFRHTHKIHKPKKHRKFAIRCVREINVKTP